MAHAPCFSCRQLTNAANTIWLWCMHTNTQMFLVWPRVYILMWCYFCGALFTPFNVNPTDWCHFSLLQEYKNKNKRNMLSPPIYPLPYKSCTVHIGAQLALQIFLLINIHEKCCIYLSFANKLMWLFLHCIPCFCPCFFHLAPSVSYDSA